MNRQIPTWENQLWHQILIHHGALYSPHGEIGKDCGCGTCFCCAAYKIAMRDREALSGRCI